VSDVEDYNFVTFHRVKNRVSEPTDVPATNARLFRFLRHIGVIDELSDGGVDAVSKIGNERGDVIKKIRNALFKLVGGRIGI
jgi:hypothetical protein